MTKNDQNDPKMAKNYPKWPKMAQNSPKWSEMFRQNGPNEARNTNTKLPDLKWQKIAKNTQIQPK